MRGSGRVQRPTLPIPAPCTREMLRGGGDAAGLALEDDLQVRQFGQPVGAAEAADMGAEGAERESREGEPGIDGGLKPGDAVADRGDAPRAPDLTQRVEGVLPVDAAPGSRASGRAPLGGTA